MIVSETLIKNSIFFYGGKKVENYGGEKSCLAGGLAAGGLDWLAGSWRGCGLDGWVAGAR